MDKVLELIEKLLPPEMRSKTKDKLLEIGVANIDDLQLVEEQDLADVLKPIQIRKLLQHCHSAKTSTQLKSQPLGKDNFNVRPGKETEVLIVSDLPKTPSAQQNLFRLFKNNPNTTPAQASECSTGSPASSGRDTPILFDTDVESDAESSGTCSTQKVLKSAASNYWINKFEIPWSKFPNSLLKACMENARPSPRDRREMIRIICDDIKDHTLFPGRKNLSKIAEMIIARFKQSFCDMIGDDVIGSGYASLQKQLEDRMANINRKDGKAKAKIDGDDDSSTNDKGKKRLTHDSYGCVNWQPDLPVHESSDNQKSMQQWLTAEFPQKNPDKTKVMKLMEKTYVSQCTVINESSKSQVSIEEIQLQWPFLFEKDCLFLHFELLMGFKIQDVMQKSMETKADVICQFMKEYGIKKRNVKDAVLALEEAMKEDQSKMPQMVGVFYLLLAYFEEPQHLMVKSFDVTGTTEEVLKDCPTTPFLAVFGNELLAKRCCLFLDCNVVNETITSVYEGIVTMFASYYMLNISYPAELSATLEFIQRCFLSINPEKGNKRAKKTGKNHAVNPKVLALANSLRDFESEWTL